MTNNQLVIILEQAEKIDELAKELQELGSHGKVILNSRAIRIEAEKIIAKIKMELLNG
jgi:hypothetical protein